ncbi:hypothetical protein ACF07D_15015 [Leucobacter sp. NPDC015123]|uniref:hypothetical protein n=1 Tax=Leucobacter sp. NPDC015123 TaxID=3364129 RepID=UPI0036F489A5
MTAREGRDKVVQLVQDSAQQLDVTGWWARGTAYAAPCEGDPDNASQYQYDYWAPEGGNPRADAKKMAAYWESLGMTVFMTGEDTDRPVVYGSGGPVLRAEFATGAVERSYQLGAIAPCSPGEDYLLNREDSAARKRGEVLPGDDVMVPESEIGEKFDEHRRLAEEVDRKKNQ